jgi:hypothetical protein
MVKEWGQTYGCMKCTCQHVKEVAMIYDFFRWLYVTFLGGVGNNLTSKRVRANLRAREMHMPTREGSSNALRLPSMAVCHLSWWCWKQLNKFFHLGDVCQQGECWRDSDDIFFFSHLLAIQSCKVSSYFFLIWSSFFYYNLFCFMSFFNLPFIFNFII